MGNNITINSVTTIAAINSVTTFAAYPSLIWAIILLLTPREHNSAASARKYAARGIIVLFYTNYFNFFNTNYFGAKCVHNYYLIRVRATRTL